MARHFIPWVTLCALSLLSIQTVYPATDLLSLGDEDSNNARNGPITFVDQLLVEQDHRTLWVTAWTKDANWSQQLGCPKGAWRSVLFEGDLNLYFGHQYEGQAYRYTQGSGNNDRSKFNLRSLIPDNALRIAGIPGSSGSVRFECEPMKEGSYLGPLTFLTIDNKNSDGTIDRPKCETGADARYCYVLGHSLYKTVTSRVGELRSFDRQKELVDQFNKRVISAKAEQVKAKANAVVARGQRSQRSTIAYVVIGIVIALGLLLFLGYMQREARRRL